MKHFFIFIFIFIYLFERGREKEIARESMSREERENRFPASRKPNMGLHPRTL